jgi:hypothetical protein
MSATLDPKPSDAAIAEARELVEKIASDYGWISPEDRAKTPTKGLRALESGKNTHAISAQRYAFDLCNQTVYSSLTM